MGNFYPVGKSGAKTIYVDKAQCELAEGQACYDITGVDLDTHDLVDQQFPILDGHGNQMYAQVPAVDQQGNPILDVNGNPTFTQGDALFETRKVFVVNATKFAAKQQMIQNQQKVSDRSKARGFCLGIIDEIAVINKESADPQLMSSLVSNPNFIAIILMLLTGGTATARALMVAHGPSLYPQATVDALVAKMDAFIASEQ